MDQETREELARIVHKWADLGQLTDEQALIAIVTRLELWEA